MFSGLLHIEVQKSINNHNNSNDDWLGALIALHVLIVEERKLISFERHLEQKRSFQFSH